MKLKLKIEELQVEAFATAATDGERGTVQAHSGPPNCYSGEWSCIPEASCGETCPLSCSPSCLATVGVCCPDS
ncbi:MAG: pinensin family lanthipeptide [Longimicrobiaceae bacterium]